MKALIICYCLITVYSTEHTLKNFLLIFFLPHCIIKTHNSQITSEKYNEKHQDSIFSSIECILYLYNKSYLQAIFQYNEQVTRMETWSDMRMLYKYMIINEGFL